jgi:hypothetical protein
MLCRGAAKACRRTPYTAVRFGPRVSDFPDVSDKPSLSHGLVARMMASYIWSVSR